MECGDLITDHIIEHVYHGLDMEPIAIASNYLSFQSLPEWHISYALLLKNSRDVKLNPSRMEAIGPLFSICHMAYMM